MRKTPTELPGATRNLSRGELGIIHQIRKRVAQQGARVPLGIGDDCALLRAKRGEDIAVTTDLSIDGRHFRLDWHPPEAIGHRTLARGLSDLAAMGARPLGAFLSLGLPRDLARVQSARGGKKSWIERFFDGLFALADAHRVLLAGGDLAESPIALADIVLVGAVPRGRAILRSGAKTGDQIYVTGALGGAAASLARLAKWSASKKHTRGIPAEFAAELTAHLYPLPRVSQGLWLQRRRAASAGIDISDGLSTDLAHLCEESGVAAEIDAGLLPIHAGATLEQALHGGEDYEILFTARESARIPNAIAGVAVTRIGRMARRRSGRPQITLVTGRERRPVAPRGWQHFS